MIFKEYSCVLLRQKANHFLNKSTVENALPQEVSRNMVF